MPKNTLGRQREETRLGVPPKQPAGGPTKICGKCAREKPAEQFYQDKNKKDGRARVCKPCARVYDHQNYMRHKTTGPRWPCPPPKPVGDGITKICSACRTRKILAEFHRAKRTPDGYACACKKCTSEYRRKRYHENRDAMRARNRKYGAEHREEIRAKARQYRLENGEKCRERARLWCHSHPEQAKAGRERQKLLHPERDREKSAAYNRRHPDRRREIGRRYRATHLEVCRARSRRQHQNNLAADRRYARARQAKKQGLGEKFSEIMEAFVTEFQEGRCAVCGHTRLPNEERLCIDHWMPLKKGYPLSMSNAVLMCRSCNSKKRTRLPCYVYPPQFVQATEAMLDDQTLAWKATSKASA